MSIFLVGGGPDTTTSPVIFDQFVADVLRRTGGSRPPRIAVVLVDHEGSAAYFLPAYLDPLHRRTPCDVVLVATPIDLRVGYELQEIGKPDLADALARF